MEELNKKLKTIQRIINKNYPFILEIKANEAMKVTLFIDILFDYSILTTKFLPYKQRDAIWKDYGSLRGIFVDDEIKEIAWNFTRKIEYEINEINDLLPKEIYKIPYHIAINTWITSKDSIPQGRTFLSL
jgi:hypothetical protein